VSKTSDDLSSLPVQLINLTEAAATVNSLVLCILSVGILNWWADIGVGPRLYPMVTSGDGNCLLHAASLGNELMIWFITHCESALLIVMMYFIFTR